MPYLLRVKRDRAIRLHSTCRDYRPAINLLPNHQEQARPSQPAATARQHQQPCLCKLLPISLPQPTPRPADRITDIPHPLRSHLLGKKSWNVYNADNIARVQRDEAAAAAEEHAAEQRMQDADAARRLAILRGETPPPLPEPEKPADPADKKHTRRDGNSGGGLGQGPRKRKRAGEDDTEFEMRVALERAEEGDRVAGELAGAGGSNKRQKQKEREEVNIVDSKGHIDLVGPPPKDAGGGGGAGKFETDAEWIARMTRESGLKFEGYEMDCLTGALTGKEAEERRQAMIKELFWNACTTAVAMRERDREDEREAERCMKAPTKNVWGKDDPKRRGRETARLDANDPLAAMRSGAKKVREVLKERRRDAEEQWRQLEQLRQEERRREKRRKKEQERADEEENEDENEDAPLPESHRSGRSERRHHGDERHEGRRVHVHREERRRRREAERARDRESDRHEGRERERSRERGSSSRSHRDKDRDGRHGHRGKDHERRGSEAKRD